MNYENEEWRDIKFTDTDGKEYDYSSLYQVSNYGRVRNSRTGRVLKLQRNKNGYIQMMLKKDANKKMFYVHRLVATMFISNDDPVNKTQVNHVDENKENNCINNLEWVTPKQNQNHGTAIERRSKKMRGKSWNLKRPRTEEYKQKMSEIKKGKNAGTKNPSAKKVICLETKQVFGCIKDAQEWSRGDVSKCCRGKQKTAGGYHWQYYEDYLREQRMQSDINNSKLVA